VKRLRHWNAIATLRLRPFLRKDDPPSHLLGRERQWVASAPAVFDRPQVVGITNDGFPVAERDPIARSSKLHFGCIGDMAGPPVVVQKQVSHLDVAHCGPAEWRGQRRVQRERFTRPRGMAIANRPPSSTACSILRSTLRWSDAQGRQNVNGKYDSQKNRKFLFAAAFRSGLATGGSSPMSRPARDNAALRALARSLSFS